MIRILSSKLVYQYVQSAQLDQIKASAKDKSTWQWVKAQLKIGKIIMSDGYKESKKDISFFYNNFNKDKELTPEQRRRIYEIKSNLWKVPPIAMLFCLPGGLPIVLLYMAFLPALTPTWFLLDKYKQQMNAKKKLVQREALQYFVECGSIKFQQNQRKGRATTTLNTEVLKNMSYTQQQKLMQLCYGQSFDGTNILRKSFKIDLNSLISPTISSYLMVKNMRERLRGQFVEDGSEGEGEGESGDILARKVLAEVRRLGCEG